MSRKYRQRGYRDDESGRERPESRTAPRSSTDGPRGRGLGRPTTTVFRCARCGAPLPPGETVEREATCPGCGSDLHSCTNCRYFDSAAIDECTAGVETRIAAKAKRNDCGSFAPKAARETSSESAESSDPRAAFDALFDL